MSASWCLWRVCLTDGEIEHQYLIVYFNNSKACLYLCGGLGLYLPMVLVSTVQPVFEA
jgi:hypothetical protein